MRPYRYLPPQPTRRTLMAWEYRQRQPRPQIFLPTFAPMRLQAFAQSALLSARERQRREQAPPTCQPPPRMESTISDRGQRRWVAATEPWAFWLRAQRPRAAIY